MATRQAFELTLGILIDRLDDFVLVTDEELYSAIRLLFGHTHNIAEGAGAAAMAACLKMKDQLAGKKVALDMSGGNLTAEQTPQNSGMRGERFGCSATDSVHQQAVRGGCMRRSLADPTNRSLAAF